MDNRAGAPESRFRAEVISKMWPERAGRVFEMASKCNCAQTALERVTAESMNATATDLNNATAARRKAIA